MNKESTFVLCLLIVGSLYGGFLAFENGSNPPALGDDRLESDLHANNTDASERNGDESSALPFDFTEASTGFNYTYQGSLSGSRTQMGSAGVYAADYDRDNRPDVLAIGGSEPVLFRNTGGEFEPSGALPVLDREVVAALFFDYDGDGWVDLLLLSDGEKPLLLENVDGEFHKRDAGFNRTLPQPVGATTADYDQDGCSDLYIIQNGNWSDGLPLGFKNYSVPPQGDNGNANHLYQGSCGSFERADDAGIRGTRWSLATSFADFNDDDRPDLHVANDFNHDVVYLNRDNGTFHQVVLPEATNRNGMSSELADVNRDGRLDIFVTNIYYPRWAAERIITEELSEKVRGNNLLINQGNGTFVDRGAEYNVAKGGWGWAATIADFDNDGDDDLFHTTQHLTFEEKASFTHEDRRRLQSHDFYSGPALWTRENGSFRNTSAVLAGFRRVDGRGVAKLDYDGDGDLDLVVATTTTYRVYENTESDTNSLQVRVENTAGSQALGADVFVRTENGTTWRHVHASTDFASQDWSVVHVGVGNASTVSMRVQWPDGTERVHEVKTDQRLIIAPEGIVDAVQFDDSNS